MNTSCSDVSLSVTSRCTACSALTRHTLLQRGDTRDNVHKQTVTCDATWRGTAQTRWGPQRSTARACDAYHSTSSMVQYCRNSLRSNRSPGVRVRSAASMSLSSACTPNLVANTRFMPSSDQCARPCVPPLSWWNRPVKSGVWHHTTPTRAVSRTLHIAAAST